VALLLLPQAVAYASLAGVDAASGLVAAALAPLPAAALASSRYLQVGPCALMSFQTASALSAVTPQLASGSAEYAAAAALLALLVSAVRLAFAAFGGGRLAEKVPHHVMEGFTLASGYKYIIAASQLPALLGLTTASGGAHAGALAGVAHVAAHTAQWSPHAAALSLATVALVLGARRLHPLCPGALLAAALGVGAQLSGAFGALGPVVGPVTLPDLAGASRVAALTALPWPLAPSLAAPAVAMAVAGFVESASVSRRFARADGTPWSGNAELASEGAAGLFATLGGGALPVGGSFSRTTLARTLGARSRTAGAVTGVVACAFLATPGAASAALAPLPRAVLAALVTLAVAPLLLPPPSMQLQAFSHDVPADTRIAALTAWATTVATFAAQQRLEYGLLAGVLFAALPAAWRWLRAKLGSRSKLRA